MLSLKYTFNYVGEVVRIYLKNIANAASIPQLNKKKLCI